MLQELSEDLNHIKKIQSEVKDTLVEIKNNLQLRIKWVIWYLGKHKTTNQNNKKEKESQKR